MKLTGKYARTYTRRYTHTHTPGSKTKLEKQWFLIDVAGKKKEKEKGGSGEKDRKEKMTKRKRGGAKKRQKREKGEKEGKMRGMGVRSKGAWVLTPGGWDPILMTLDRHECFHFFSTCKRTNNANNTTHYVKLGKNRRESSQRNYFSESSIF